MLAFILVLAACRFRFEERTPTSDGPLDDAVDATDPDPDSPLACNVTRVTPLGVTFEGISATLGDAGLVIVVVAAAGTMRSVTAYRIADDGTIAATRPLFTSNPGTRASIAAVPGKVIVASHDLGQYTIAFLDPTTLVPVAAEQAIGSIVGGVPSLAASADASPTLALVGVTSNLGVDKVRMALLAPGAPMFVPVANSVTDLAFQGDLTVASAPTGFVVGWSGPSSGAPQPPSCAAVETTLAGTIVSGTLFLRPAPTQSACLSPRLARRAGGWGVVFRESSGGERFYARSASVVSNANYADLTTESTRARLILDDNLGGYLAGAVTTPLPNVLQLWSLDALSSTLTPRTPVTVGTTVGPFDLVAGTPPLAVTTDLAGNVGVTRLCP